MNDTDDDQCSIDISTINNNDNSESSSLSESESIDWQVNTNEAFTIFLLQIFSMFQIYDSDVDIN